MNNESMAVTSNDSNFDNITFYISVFCIAVILPLVTSVYVLAWNMPKNTDRYTRQNVQKHESTTTCSQVISNEITADSVREKVEEVAEAVEVDEKVKGICIDESLFNSTQVRLNTEVYDLTAGILNEEHIIKDFGEPETELYKSYIDNVNPLIPIAMTIGETGMWADTRYTWSSAVYTKPLGDKGVDLEKLHIEKVNEDTYIVNGLKAYLGCGSNCTASASQHNHTSGLNDNSSLGPLQILRQYVEATGSLVYECGDTTTDLMNWQDNVEWFMHKQSETFSNTENWNKDHEIQSTYELVALMGVGHNTGLSFQECSSAGSLWKNSQAVFDFCECLGSEENVAVMQEYIDEWYEYVKEQQENDEAFIMAGNYYANDFDQLLKEMDINKSSYANGWKHKQWYPVKAVLNYMSIEKLYNSGRDDTNGGFKENNN